MKLNFFYLIKRILVVLKVLLYYKWIFNAIDIKTYIKKPLQIDCPKNIHLGRVNIGYYTWLAANPLTGKTAVLIIEDGCNIGNFNHIYATSSIILHKNVLTADKVYISDNLHGYEIVDLPVNSQPIKQIDVVEIGEGSWLGENVCVIGAKIGKHCVIGANSVVTKDIPDYSVAVGAPARVIKKYNFSTGRWERL